MDSEPRSSGEAQFNAALKAARSGRLVRAEQLAAQAVRSTGLSSDLAMRLANLRGGIAFERGSLEQAEERFEETLKWARRLNAPVMAARATTNLASIAHLRGKIALTLSLYESALEVYQKHGDHSGEAQASHNLGLVYREMGRLTAAARCSERAVTAARASDDRALLGLTLLGRAETWLERGDRTRARRDLRLTERLVGQTRDRVGAVDVIRLKARLELGARRYPAALSLARRGCRLASQVGSAQLLGECAALTAEASERLRDEGTAARYRRTAVDCFDALGARGKLRRMRWPQA